MLVKGLWLLMIAAGLVAAGSGSVTVTLAALAVLAGLVGLLCWSIGAAQLAIVQLALELVVIYYLAKETKASVTRTGWSPFALLAFVLLAVVAGFYLWPAFRLLAGPAAYGEEVIDWASLIGGVIVVLTAMAGALTIGLKREEKA
jgi:hypothetical protein